MLKNLNTKHQDQYFVFSGRGVTITLIKLGISTIENDCILMIGYCGEDTLGYKIKHGKDNKTININGKPIKNKAQVCELHSFSSHIQHDQMLNYYKSINCEKIYLVHSDDNKVEFKNELQEAINDCLKSTRVVAVNSGTKITLR